MSAVGQIYWRVLDVGEYITTDNLTKDYFYYNTEESASNKDHDLVKFYQATQFTKLGVQAPPGTRMIINDNKAIMVGRTGIYELDEDIPVTSLKFVRPRKYSKDPEASVEAEENGINAMQDAEDARQRKLQALNSKYGSVPESGTDPNFEAYWDEYQKIQDEYITAYEKGLGQYSTGRSGIYTLPDPANKDADVNYEELYNVIVDFVYD